QNMMLHDPHRCTQMIAVAAEHARLNHLRNKIAGVIVKVLKQPFEITGRGSGNEGTPTPVGEQRSRMGRSTCQWNRFDDQLSTPEPCLVARGRRRPWERPIRRTARIA